MRALARQPLYGSLRGLLIHLPQLIHTTDSISLQDLRIYTIWRSDLVRSTQQQRPYRKSATEWEILGELAQRLHHLDEAEEAFQACLHIRFSPKSLRGILQAQEKGRDHRGSLDSIIRLTAWQYRGYSEVRTSPRETSHFRITSYGDMRNLTET